MSHPRPQGHLKKIKKRPQRIPGRSLSSRTVSFADNNLVVDYEEETEGTLIEYMLQDLSDSSTKQPLSRLALIRRKRIDRLVLTVDGKWSHRSKTQTEAGVRLIEKVLYLLTEQNFTGLAFHAGALSLDDFGILVPGMSGSGKSTLSAWLTSKGYNYLTDELAHIPLDQDLIHGFTRPINIKHTGFDLLKELLGERFQSEHTLHNKEYYLVPHRLINPSYSAVRPKLRLLLFPSVAWDKEESSIQEISKAQAGLKLVNTLVNGRNLPHHGFDQITRLVKDVPAYTLKYRGFEQLPDLLNTVLPKAVSL